MINRHGGVACFLRARLLRILDLNVASVVGTSAVAGVWICCSAFLRTIWLFVDPAFFIRLKQARLLREDRDESCRDYHSPLFISGDAERDYYKRFPTIYHLRAWLMTTEKKADLRQVYLALHNIVKHRGNFLHQDNPNLSATAANMEESVERLCLELEDRCAALDIPCACDAASIRQVFADPSLARA